MAFLPSKHALGCPTPRSIRNPALDFTLGGSWRPFPGSQAPLYVPRGHVVFWVVSPSKDRIRLLISLQNRLSVFSAEIPSPGWVTLKILLKPVWAAFSCLQPQENERLNVWNLTRAWEVSTGPLGLWSAEGLLQWSLLLIRNHWNPPKNYDWKQDTGVKIRISVFVREGGKAKTLEPLGKH